jgi:hypothetical protein
MEKKIKVSCILLAFVLALSMILTGCSSNEPSVGDPITAGAGENAGDDVEEAAKDPRDISDGLDPADYGGETIRILYRNGCSRGNWALYDVHKIEIAAEEETGDVINDALYRRNKTVEERFNVNIVGMPYPNSSTNESEVAAYARRSINANSDDVDIVVTWSNHLANLAADGLFVDWNSIPNIDIEKPWWIKDAMKAFTINGKTYLAMSDIIFSGVVGEAGFIMFNKELLAKFGLENPYTMGEENRWTIDILSEIVKGCYADVNGDGKRDADDTFGFTSDAWGSAYAWMWAGGSRATSKDANTGLPYYDLYTERNVSMLNKVNDLFYNNTGSAITNAKGNSIDFKGRGDQSYLFSSGNALFMLDRVGVLCTPDYRNAPFEFGIVPIPKYDQTQEKYLTMINEHASAMAVPVYNGKLEMTGKIIEALSAESYKQLVPAYYEVALKTKYSRDEESVRMLDLIFEGVVYDFGLLYAIPTFDIYQTILCNTQDPSTFASQIEKNQVKAENALQKILDLYDAID